MLITKRLAVIGLVLGLVSLLGCRQPTPLVEAPSPTPEPTFTATEPVSPSATPLPPADTATPAPSSTPSPTQTPVPPTPVPTPTISPTSTPEPDTETLLLQAVIPPRNLDDLAQRFNRAAPSDTPPNIRNNYLLGDTESFWVADNSTLPPGKFQMQAELRYLTDHAYWWVEQGFSVPDDNLIASAERFETQIYPTTRALFGSEASPGIDNDVRVHVVMGNVPGVAGYYAASNQVSRAANEFSNQKEMFLINLNAIRPGNDRFDGVIAHEFQHMIHWNMDLNESTWVNEGLSEFSKLANGFGPSGFVSLYSSNPDLQLTNWGRDDATRRANYGASYLFITYFHDRFGEDLLRQLVARPENSVAGFEQVLTQAGQDLHFDTLFQDFVIANFLNQPELSDGRWGYVSESGLNPMNIETRHDTFPVEIDDVVNQYGVDYIEIVADGEVVIEFAGPQRNRLISNEAYSGSYQWYSNRGDQSNPRLTRAFDLRELSAATLTFQAWYDIEADWDYAYVAASRDKGTTWTILQATDSSTTNPVGNAYGPGFTGSSGNPPEWRPQTVDLTPFAGEEILLRFEYVTDDAVSLPGFAIDDIAIPALNYFDDVETGRGEWVAEGFVRTDNLLPQRFQVQVIAFPTEGEPLIGRMQLDEQNQGRLSVPGLGDTVARAVLVISAQALKTTNPVNYTYRLTRP